MRVEKRRKDDTHIYFLNRVNIHIHKYNRVFITEYTPVERLKKLCDKEW